MNEKKKTLIKSLVCVGIAFLFTVSFVSASTLITQEKNMWLAPGEGNKGNFDIGDAKVQNLKSIKINTQLSGEVLYKLKLTFLNDNEELSASLIVDSKMHIHLLENGSEETSALFSQGQSIYWAIQIMDSNGSIVAERDGGATFKYGKNIELKIRSLEDMSDMFYNPVSEYPWTDRGELVSSYALQMDFAKETILTYSLHEADRTGGSMIGRSWDWGTSAGLRPGWAEWDLIRMTSACTLTFTYTANITIHEYYYGYLRLYADGDLIFEAPSGWHQSAEVEIAPNTSVLRFEGTHNARIYHPLNITGPPAIVVFFALPALEDFHMTGNEWSLTQNYVLKTPTSWTTADEDDPNAFLITYEQAEAILANPVLMLTNLSARDLTVDRLKIIVSYANKGKVSEW